MTRMIAYLRAINVGGHGVITMAELKKPFEKLKFTNVETFIASGNVIFETKLAPAKVEEAVEAALEKAFGAPVPTFIRTAEEVKGLSEFKPFPPKVTEKALASNVGFLKRELTKDETKELLKAGTEVDVLAVHGREVHWLCHVRQSDSKFSLKKFEKATGVLATFRSANTIARMAAKYPPL